MDEAEITRYIRGTFEGVLTLENSGDSFFIYDPARDLPPERQQPFATIVTGDHYDKVSGLDRPGAFRLNIGVAKPTYLAMLGAPPTERDEQGVLIGDADYAAVDTFMPHPFYASQHWVSVIDPGPANWANARDLLAEAHALAARKHANHQKRLRRP